MRDPAEKLARKHRKNVRQAAEELGHVLTGFKPYKSCPGKWTAYCRKCGKIAIVYDTPPPDCDQVSGVLVRCAKAEGPVELEDNIAEEPEDEPAGQPVGSILRAIL